MLSSCRKAGSSFRTCPCLRRASTSANPYPYPSHTNPTPHQIFHLPRSATKQDVKDRYYELVRIYHPDSPISRKIPPPTAQARFQAITAAYDALRGKMPLNGPHADTELGSSTKSRLHNLHTAVWKAKQHRRAELNVGLDDRWKDRIMLGAITLTIALFVGQTYFTRVQAMQSQHDRALRHKSESRASRNGGASGNDKTFTSLSGEGD